MVQHKILTDEEQLRMYDKLSKSEIIQMLIEANKVIEHYNNHYSISTIVTDDSLKKNGMSTLR